jgi:hypothetical protein
MGYVITRDTDNSSTDVVLGNWSKTFKNAEIDIASSGRTTVTGISGAVSFEKTEVESIDGESPASSLSDYRAQLRAVFPNASSGDGGEGGTSLPSQTGKAGYVLSTDGSDASWQIKDTLLVRGLQAGTGNAVANADVVSDAIVTAAALGVGVALPSGRFYFSTIEWDGTTPIIGAGIDKTILTSVTNVPLIYTGIHDGNIIVTGGGIHNLTLDGNNIGTRGIEYHCGAWSLFSQLKIIGFNTSGSIGFYSKGSLSYTIRDCFFGGNYDSIKLRSGNVSDLNGTGIAANYINIEDCIMGGASLGSSHWAIDISEGALVKVSSCDFEFNGNGVDADSGAIYVHGMQDGSTSYGVLIDGCWLENNTGHTIKFGANYRKSIHRISNTQVSFATNALSLLNVDDFTNQVVLDCCSIDGRVDTIPSGHTDVIVSNKGIIEAFNCPRIYKIKELTGGRYYENGMPTDIQSGNGGSSFDTLIQTLSPIYYNRMAGSSSPIAPTVGTGNAVIAGGFTFNSYTPFPYDSNAGAIMKNDTESGSTLTVNAAIPAGNTEIVVCWWSCDSPGYDNLFVFTPSGGGGWDNTNGGFAWAENQLTSTYYGVYGSAGLAFGSDAPRIAKEGWHFHALRIHNNRFLSYNVDGVKVWTNGASANGSTNDFADGAFTWVFGYRIGPIAILPGATTDAQITSLAKSRYN